MKNKKSEKFGLSTELQMGEWDTCLEREGHMGLQKDQSDHLEELA